MEAKFLPVSKGGYNHWKGEDWNESCVELELG